MCCSLLGSSLHFYLHTFFFLFNTQNGKFVPEKSNIWRDCVDGYYDWVKEHIEEVRH